MLIACKNNNKRRLAPIIVYILCFMSMIDISGGQGFSLAFILYYKCIIIPYLCHNNKYTKIIKHHSIPIFLAAFTLLTQPSLLRVVAQSSHHIQSITVVRYVCHCSLSIYFAPTKLECGRTVAD